MPRTIRIAIVSALSAALLGTAALPAQAARPPKTFFGVQPISRPSDEGFRKLNQGKVGTYRAGFFWSNIEPLPGVFNWSDPDDNVRRGALNGVTILPVLFGTPDWAGRQSHDRPPIKNGKVQSGDYVKFVRQVVLRYGPRGSFWKENPSLPKRPIRAWQIWNEPNLAQFWPCKKRGKFCRPVAKEYANFATPASKAIKKVDRGAKIVLAGLPETKTASKLLPYLTALYNVKGFKNQFDVVALHPYARDHTGVKGAVIAIRKVMSKAGDAKSQLWLTEIGWSSAGSNKNFAVGDKGQATRLTNTFKFLISNRKKYKIGMGAWFTMQDRPADGTYSPEAWQRRAGLFTEAGAPKRSWRALMKLTGGKTSGGIGVGSVGQAPAPGPGGSDGDGGSGANPDGDPASGGGGTPAGSGGGGGDGGGGGSACTPTPLVPICP